MDFKKSKNIQDSNKSDESLIGLRDSFSHRFCDDLSEFVLNFLPIDHKIKLTEVSKQFQRYLQNIHRKQRILIIRHKKIDSAYHRNNYPELLIDRYSPNGHRINEKKFVKILKIFPNITEIYIEEKDIKNISVVMSAIIDNCSHLTSLRLDSMDSRLDHFKYFGQKFGLQIRNLWSLERIYPKDWDIYCYPLEFIELPNLKAIFGFELSALFKDEKILVKNLKKATLCYDFVCKNKNKLFNIFIENNLDLIHLGIDLEYNCYDSDDSQLLEAFLQKVLALKKLRKLDLILSLDYVEEEEEEYENRIDLNIIKNCEQLTHLKLDSYLIDDHFFVDFDKSFPHLKCLDISVRYGVTDKALESMSKLKYLESLSLNCSPNNCSPEISDSGVMALIKGCKRLRRLDWNLKTFISMDSIFKCIKNKIELKLFKK